MIKYMSKSMMESDEDVMEIQTFNKDGVTYGVGGI